MICRWLAGRIPGGHGVVTHNKRNNSVHGIINSMVTDIFLRA